MSKSASSTTRKIQPIPANQAASGKASPHALATLVTLAEAQKMAEFFGTLSDPNRLRLLSALAQQELCVSDLAAMIEMGESAVSHQLRILRSQRFVKYRRAGRKIYYSLADDHITRLYQDVAAHLAEEH